MAWHSDTAAINHITPDLANLSIYNDYKDTAKLTVINGYGL